MKLCLLLFSFVFSYLLLFSYLPDFHWYSLKENYDSLKPLYLFLKAAEQVNKPAFIFCKIGNWKLQNLLFYTSRNVRFMPASLLFRLIGINVA